MWVEGPKQRKDFQRLCSAVEKRYLAFCVFQQSSSLPFHYGAELRVLAGIAHVASCCSTGDEPFSAGLGFGCMQEHLVLEQWIG